VQRQGLQLKAERLVEASVRAIDAADAVVDRSELEKIRRAKQQRLGAQQHIERLFELVRVEEMVAEAVQDVALERDVASGSSIGGGLLVERPLLSRSIGDTRSSCSVARARPARSLLDSYAATARVE
jgi:hypothetical protein